MKHDTPDTECFSIPGTNSKWVRTRRHTVLRFGMICVLMFLAIGCERTPTVPSTEEPLTDTSPADIVQLAAEESSLIGIVVQPVTRDKFKTYREFPAIIQPNRHTMANITTLVRGRVEDVYVEIGQQVETNTLLAVLHSSELGLAQSTYLKARAKLHVAAQAYTRAKLLVKEKVIGTAELQRRHADLISVQADANEARNRLVLLGVTEEEIQRLDRTRHIRSHVPIVAPFAGRIINRNLTRGEVVETTETLFIIADLSEVWVLANIPEKDIGFIHSNHRPGGTPTEIRINAYPQEVFTGTVTYIADVLDPVTRTMQLRVEIPNPDGRLKPEMFAKIRLFSESKPDRLAVPESAVQRDEDSTFVFVKRNESEYEVREVQIGESNGTHVTILSGLNEGDSIVTSGAFVLKSELAKKNA